MKEHSGFCVTAAVTCILCLILCWNERTIGDDVVSDAVIESAASITTTEGLLEHLHSEVEPGNTEQFVQIAQKATESDVESVWMCGAIAASHVRGEALPGSTMQKYIAHESPRVHRTAIIMALQNPDLVDEDSTRYIEGLAHEDALIRASMALCNNNINELSGMANDRSELVRSCAALRIGRIANDNNWENDELREQLLMMACDHSIHVRAAVMTSMHGIPVDEKSRLVLRSLVNDDRMGYGIGFFADPNIAQFSDRYPAEIIASQPIEFVGLDVWVSHVFSLLITEYGQDPEARWQEFRDDIMVIARDRRDCIGRLAVILLVHRGTDRDRTYCREIATSANISQELKRQLEGVLNR